MKTSDVTTLVDAWLIKFDPHFHARDSQRREELVSAIVALAEPQETLLNEAAEMLSSMNFENRIDLLTRIRALISQHSPQNQESVK